MRVEIVATAELVRADGLECRIWRGASPKGVPFFMLCPLFRGEGDYAESIPTAEHALFRLNRTGVFSVRGVAGTVPVPGERVLVERGAIVLVNGRPLRTWGVLLFRGSVPRREAHVLALRVAVACGRDGSEFDGELTSDGAAPADELERLVIESAFVKLETKEAQRG